jgi:hypothetical protein
MLGRMSQPLPEQPTAPLPAFPGNRPGPRRRWLIVVAGAALAAAVLGGAGWVLLDAPASTTPAAPASSSPPARKQGGGHGVRGTIVSEAGSTWIIRTAAGRTVTVLIGAQTLFGTAKAPKTAADFPVGAPVAVTGTVDHDTITATRITIPRPAPSSTGPTPSATT